MTCREDKVKCCKDKKPKTKQSTTYLLDDDDIESILDNTESLLDNVEEVLDSLDSQLDDSDEGYLYEPLHKKTNKMLGRKQRRRSASR